MPRPNAPWFRASRDAWYVTLNGRLRSLGVSGRRNRMDAFSAFARLLAGEALPAAEAPPVAEVPPPPPPAPPAPTAATAQSVVVLALASCKSRVKPATLARYTSDALAFCDVCGALPAAELTPAAVAGWLHGLKVNDTTKSIMLRSVSAVLGRAVAIGALPSNPARSVPRPRGRCRSASAIISPADHAKLLAGATPELAVVLRLLYATGARPGEVCGITAENFDSVNAVVVLAVHKTDRTGKPRLLFLPPDAVALLTAARAIHPAGPLLRSNKGVPWNARSVTQAIRKRKKAAGTPHAIAYGYRHTFATDALSRGIPDATVAALLGHTSTAVLHLHYSHLTSNSNLLRSAAAKVRGGQPLNE